MNRSLFVLLRGQLTNQSCNCSMPARTQWQRASCV